MYLINKDGQKGIYISEKDYKKVKENKAITIPYFETVNIIIKAVYNNQELEYSRFFTIRNWKLW